jgi:protein-S-isoprenylcysteine O-methyltransferase Ste14
LDRLSQGGIFPVVRDFFEQGGLWVVGQGAVFLVVALALWAFAADDVAAGMYWPGIAVATAGVALSADGVFRIRRHNTALPTPVAGAPLIEQGSFRLARHPIYGGLVIAAIGLSIARGSILGAAAGGALAIFFVLKSSHEELLLESAYPDYGAYRSRVRRRLIPWIL